ncbi:MAG: hypothetical protein NTU73_07855, partial [Ignavibacteriae bacterium]|nr:hypothetical protein [Ignavibacteriota bacterium]
MKNSIYALLVILFFSVLFFSCNKDDAVSPGNGNNNNTGPITQTFSSNITTPIPIAPNTFTSDSLNANITFGINASNVSDVKLNLNTLEGVIVSNLRFALFHNGVEVFVI